jgi:hypothetical protein
MKKDRVITRRDFLRGTVYTSIAASLGSSLEKDARAGEKVKVALIRDEMVIDHQGRINQKILQHMSAV